MRASWTRDEVILGLDVLILMRFRGLTQNHPKIIELSNLLNQLPIIPMRIRHDSFRNTVGVSAMLRNFWEGFEKSGQKFKVGELFYCVYQEYSNNFDELHKIAQAIRRCAAWVGEQPFGDPAEAQGFPEGAILGHVHRLIEARFAEKQPVPADAACAVCGLRPVGLYAGLDGQHILSWHWLVAPVDVDPALPLKPDDFILLCANCHQALHQIRPWRGRNTYGNILLI